MEVKPNKLPQVSDIGNDARPADRHDFKGLSRCVRRCRRR